MAGTYERLTDRGKQLMDFLFNAVIVLGGLALLGWLVSPAR
jgi:hypothetical protein